VAKRISRHQQNEKMSAVRRGELYLVALDPTVGYEIQKIRPALIIQNNIGNQYSPLTITAAVTSKLSSVSFPVEVVVEPSRVNGLNARSAHHAPGGRSHQVEIHFCPMHDAVPQVVPGYEESPATGPKLICDPIPHTATTQNWKMRERSL
jgi:mRNA-degrading endonuclease toxin of MazEF toxin-antitoxin module